MFPALLPNYFISLWRCHNDNERFKYFKVFIAFEGYKNSKAKISKGGQVKAELTYDTLGLHLLNAFLALCAQ